MWNKQQTQPEAPGAPPVPASPSPASVAFSAPSAPRPATSTGSRSSARLGAGLHIKGQLTGTEDLQIDGKVQGPISLQGRRLTVGRPAELNSDVTAGEVIVYGKVMGKLHARDRVEIKKGGSVFGDITTVRISIEDGADFKGRIEIDYPKPQSGANSESVGVPVAAETI